MVSLLAHQWGWDEVLMFAIPIGIAFFGVRWAERRARRRSQEQPEEGADQAF